MTVPLPPQLAFLPGYAPDPQEELPVHKGESAQGQPQPTAENQASTKQEGTPEKGKQGPQQMCGDPTMLFVMGGVLVVMWFLMIRPQQKQEKKRREMLATVKKNDKVVTASGIHGTVAALDEKTVTLKLDDKGQLRVKFDRSAIGRILGPDQE